MPVTNRETDYPSLGIVQSLFSEVQLKVLAILFGQQNRTSQMSEMISLVNSDAGAVHRIIIRFVKSGLVDKHITGRTKFYQQIPSPLYSRSYTVL